MALSATKHWKGHLKFGCLFSDAYILKTQKMSVSGGKKEIGPRVEPLWGPRGWIANFLFVSNAQCNGRKTFIGINDAYWDDAIRVKFVIV